MNGKSVAAFGPDKYSQIYLQNHIRCDDLRPLKRKCENNFDIEPPAKICNYVPEEEFEEVEPCESKDLNHDVKNVLTLCLYFKSNEL